MKNLKKTTVAACALLVSAAWAAWAADDKPAFRPHPVTATFYVAGMHCDNCIKTITHHVSEVPSVTQVDIRSAEDGYARISFDTHVSSYHQIAQAIAEAGYKASLRFEVPDYAQPEYTDKLNALFDRLSDRVRIETLDAKQGKFELHFLPLKLDPAATRPQGFNAGHLGHPIHDAPPKGLGLTFKIQRERG